MFGRQRRQIAASRVDASLLQNLAIDATNPSKAPGFHFRDPLLTQVLSHALQMSWRRSISRLGQGRGHDLPLRRMSIEDSASIQPPPHPFVKEQ